MSFGVGVERTFPVHSPIIAKIEVVSRGDVRRAKLYYLRDRVGKAAKVKEKRSLSPEDLENYEAERELALAQEYQDVSAMFAYAVETERRFYLANEVDVRVQGDGARPLIEVELTRRVGLGHVPPDPLRPFGSRPDVQGRERRGAPEAPKSDQRRRARRAGRGTRCRLVRGQRLRGARPQLAPPRGRDRPRRCSAIGCSCSAR